MFNLKLLKIAILTVAALTLVFMGSIGILLADEPSSIDRPPLLKIWTPEPAADYQMQCENGVCRLKKVERSTPLHHVNREIQSTATTSTPAAGPPAQAFSRPVWFWRSRFFMRR